MSAPGVDLVIEGVAVTMVRAPGERLSVLTDAVFGPEVSIVDSWREQARPDHIPVNLSMARFGKGAYLAIVWERSPAVTDACIEYRLPGALAVDVYGLAECAPEVDSDERARIVGRELARLVAHAQLPWPPKTAADGELWTLAGTLVERDRTA